MASALRVSRTGDVNVTLAVPSDIPSTAAVQFSITKAEDDTSAIFMPERMKLSELRSANDGSKMISFRHNDIPRFSSGGDVMFKAHFMKGERCLDNVDLGLYSA